MSDNLRLRSESVRDYFCRDSYYFSLVIDWIMTTTTTGRKKMGYSGHSGSNSAGDLDCADDLVLLCNSHNQIHDKTAFHENEG